MSTPILFVLNQKCTVIEVPNFFFYSFLHLLFCIIFLYIKRHSSSAKDQNLLRKINLHSRRPNLAHYHNSLCLSPLLNPTASAISSRIYLPWDLCPLLTLTDQWDQDYLSCEHGIDISIVLVKGFVLPISNYMFALCPLRCAPCEHGCL